MKKRWSKKAIITISALVATVLIAGIALISTYFFSPW